MEAEVDQSFLQSFRNLSQSDTNQKISKSEIKDSERNSTQLLLLTQQLQFVHRLLKNLTANMNVLVYDYFKVRESLKDHDLLQRFELAKEEQLSFKIPDQDLNNFGMGTHRTQGDSESRKDIPLPKTTSKVALNSKPIVPRLRISQKNKKNGMKRIKRISRYESESRRIISSRLTENRMERVSNSAYTLKIDDFKIKKILTEKENALALKSHFGKANSKSIECGSCVIHNYELYKLFINLKEKERAKSLGMMKKFKERSEGGNLFFSKLNRKKKRWNKMMGKDRKEGVDYNSKLSMAKLYLKRARKENLSNSWKINLGMG